MFFFEINHLVGGWTNTHLKNMLIQMGIFPKVRGEKKICETTTQIIVRRSLVLTFICMGGMSMLLSFLLLFSVVLIILISIIILLFLLESLL